MDMGQLMTGDQFGTPETVNVELRKLELEAGLRRDELAERVAQREADTKLREAELEIKRLELQTATKHGLSNSKVAILVAATTAISGLISAMMVESIKGSETLRIEQQKANFQHDLDRDKFETTLILRATENKEVDERIRNLRFYIEAGYIKDPEGKIAKMDAGQYPATTMSQLPPNGASFGTDFGCGRPALVVATWTGLGKEQVYTSVLPMLPHGLDPQRGGIAKEEFDAVNKVFMENAGKVAAFANRWHDYGRMPPPEAVAAFRNSLPQPAHFELVENCQLEGINLAISRLNAMKNGEAK